MNNKPNQFCTPVDRLALIPYKYFRLILMLAAWLVCSIDVSAHEKHVDALLQLQNRLKQKNAELLPLIEAYKARFGASSILEVSEDGSVSSLVGFTKNGKSVFYVTDNVDAAISTASNVVYPGGVENARESVSGIRVYPFTLNLKFINPNNEFVS